MSWVTDQKIIEIAGIKTPILDEGDVVYYPIRYIFRMFFNRDKTKPSHKYDKYMEYKTIDYSFLNLNSDTNLQTTKCITREGLVDLVGSMSLGNLKNEEQLNNYYNLRTYLGMGSIKPNDVANINKDNFKDYIKEYPVFIKDCIEGCMGRNKDLEWKLCKKCGNVYPLISNFFSYIVKNDKFNDICKDCQEVDSVRILNCNTKLTDIYYNKGEDRYLKYKNNFYLELYKDCNKKDIPDELKTKEIYLDIIKYLYKARKLTKQDLNSKILARKFGLVSIRYGKSGVVDIHTVYEHLFGNNFWHKLWKFKKYKPVELVEKQGFIIMEEYIKAKKIKIDNIFTYNYSKLLKECNIYDYFSSDILGFIVNFYKRKYPGYKFKVSNKLYYESKDNMQFDMKYLIEKDLKIQPIKTPLYVTKHILNRNYKKIYTGLFTSKHNAYKDIYTLVNDCYPGMFVEADFNVGIIRNKFDSMEESRIHCVLKEHFPNTIYNQRNTEHEIKIKNLEPDWFILLDNKCILVEYFGLYSPNPNNSRTIMYRKKMDVKLERYKDLTNYEKFFIYPDDLKDNMEGLLTKIDELKSKYQI